MEWMERVGFVEVEEGVVAAGKNSGDVVAQKFMLWSVHNTNGAVTTFLECNAGQGIGIEDKEAILGGGGVKDRFPAPRCRRRNGHDSHGRAPALGGDDGATMGAEANEDDVARAAFHADKFSYIYHPVARHVRVPCVSHV